MCYLQTLSCIFRHSPAMHCNFQCADTLFFHAAHDGHYSYIPPCSLLSWCRQVQAALHRDPAQYVQRHAREQAKVLERSGIALPSAAGIDRLTVPDTQQQQHQQQHQHAEHEHHGPEADSRWREAANADKPKHTAELLNKLHLNGFFGHRLVRVRLLHYFICRVMGKSGPAERCFRGVWDMKQPIFGD